MNIKPKQNLKIKYIEINDSINLKDFFNKNCLITSITKTEGPDVFLNITNMSSSKANHRIEIYFQKKKYGNLWLNINKEFDISILANDISIDFPDDYTKNFLEVYTPTILKIHYYELNDDELDEYNIFFIKTIDMVFYFKNEKNVDCSNLIRIDEKINNITDLLCDSNNKIVLFNPNGKISLRNFRIVCNDISTDKFHNIKPSEYKLNKCSINDVPVMEEGKFNINSIENFILKEYKNFKSPFVLEIDWVPPSGSEKIINKHLFFYIKYDVYMCETC